MKRIIASIAAAALALAMFGCGSGQPASSDASSSSATSSASSSAESSADSSAGNKADNINPDVPAKPPIACKEEGKLGNFSIKVPKKWGCQTSLLGWINIGPKDGSVQGRFSVEDEPTFEGDVDAEFTEYIKGVVESALQNGYKYPTDFTLYHKGNLTYVVLPFTAKVKDVQGNDEARYGYSFAGWDGNKLAIIEMSSNKNDKKILETINWILNNVQTTD